jgi:adenylate cyclase
VDPDPITRELAVGLRSPHLALPTSGPRSGPGEATEGGAVLLTLPDRPSVAVLPAPSRSAVPILAVLPFTASAPDAQLECFAGILLDCLVGALCALREPIVISANSTRTIDASADNGPSVGRRLGAHYVAAGRLQRIGECISLSVELAETTSGTLLWQTAHDLSDTSLFQVPHELAATIAHILVPHIKATELQNARRRRQDASAYQLVLDAQSLMFRLEPTSFQLAKRLLKKAAILDPGFALPHAVLGAWYSLCLGQRWSRDSDDDTKSLNNELRLALELDPGNSRALALLGHSHTIQLRQYDVALDLLDRSLEAAPNDAETCMWASPTLAYVGRAKEAVRNALNRPGFVGGSRS